MWWLVLSLVIAIAVGTMARGKVGTLLRRPKPNQNDHNDSRVSYARRLAARFHNPITEMENESLVYVDPDWPAKHQLGCKRSGIIRIIKDVHKRTKASDTSLFVGVQVFDRYMSLTSGHSFDESIVLALCCLGLAIKFEDDIVGWHLDGTETIRWIKKHTKTLPKFDILRVELDVLGKLGGRLDLPTTMTFLATRINRLYLLDDMRQEDVDAIAQRALAALKGTLDTTPILKLRPSEVAKKVFTSAATDAGLT